MILTKADGRSTRFDAAVHVPALAACDRVRVFSEAGWGVVSGFSGTDLRVNAHASDEASIRSAFARADLILHGDRLVEMSVEEKRASASEERTAWSRYR